MARSAATMQPLGCGRCISQVAPAVRCRPVPTGSEACRRGAKRMGHFALARMWLVVRGGGKSRHASCQICSANPLQSRLPPVFSCGSWQPILASPSLAAWLGYRFVLHRSSASGGGFIWPVVEPILHSAPVKHQEERALTTTTRPLALRSVPDSSRLKPRRST